MPEGQHILFVFGAARSGTTFLNGFLEDWFDYGMGPEGAFIADLASRLPAYGDLAVAANFERLAADVAGCEALEIPRRKYPEGARFDVTVEMLLAQSAERTYPALVEAALRCMAKLQGRRRLGNKFPGYWRHLDVLESLFASRARYLCIVRDGRDVALSALRMPWGPSSVFAGARDWRDSLAATERFRAIARERLHVVRYEDLLEGPRAAIPDLESFLGVDLGAARRAEAIALIEESEMRWNFGRWRERMRPADIRRFEAVAGEWLSRYGYERVHEAPDVSLGERSWYTARELSRKAVATIEHWLKR